jgi:hypothetical protein
MPAAWLERRLLIVTAVALYGAVFIAFVAFEVPGLARAAGAARAKDISG